MADRMTAAQRHHCMSSIRGTDTRPEMVVRRWLWRQGFRYRLHVRSLPGTPDVVMRRWHTVIFVNGCFWHGHEACGHFHLPKTNTDFWRAKITRNRQHDERNHKLLAYMGWHVIVVWECQLANDQRQATLQALSRRLSQIVLAANGAEPYAHLLAAEPLAPDPAAQPLAAEPPVHYGKTQV